MTLETVPRRLILLPPGNPGILQSLDELLRILRAPQPDAVPVARALLASLPPERRGDPFYRLFAAYDYVQRALVYQRDEIPFEDDLTEVDGEPIEERFRTPSYLLALIAQQGWAPEDCDGYVILLGTLVRLLGLRQWAVLSSAREDQEYDHIFLEVDVGGRLPITADAIPDDDGTYRPLGWRVPAPAITNLYRVAV